MRGTSSGSPSPVIVATPGVQTPMDSNAWFSSASVTNIEADNGRPPRSTGSVAPGASSQTATTSSASGYASGSSKMLSTTANVVVAAPLPIASVATATSVSNGLRSSARNA